MKYRIKVGDDGAVTVQAQVSHNGKARWIGQTAHVPGEKADSFAKALEAVQQLPEVVHVRKRTSAD